MIKTAAHTAIAIAVGFKRIKEMFRVILEGAQISRKVYRGDSTVTLFANYVLVSCTRRITCATV